MGRILGFRTLVDESGVCNRKNYVGGFATEYTPKNHSKPHKQGATRHSDVFRVPSLTSSIASPCKPKVPCAKCNEGIPIAPLYRRNNSAIFAILRCLGPVVVVDEKKAMARGQQSYYHRVYTLAGLERPTKVSSRGLERKDIIGKNAEIENKN